MAIRLAWTCERTRTAASAKSPRGVNRRWPRWRELGQLLAVLLIGVAAVPAGAVETAATAATPLELYLYQRGYIEGGSDATTSLTLAAVRAFEQREAGGVRVRVIGVPWGKEGDLKLRTALLARRRIDVFRLASDQLPGFVPRRGRLLAPIDGELSAADRDDFGPALEALRARGETLAWPLWSTAIGLLANPELLARAGVAAPTDGTAWNWAEFTAALEALGRLKDAQGRPVHGLHAASRPPLFEWAPLLMADAGPLFATSSGAEPGDLPLAPGLAGALQRVAKLKARGLLDPGFGVDDQPGAQAAFLEGRVGLLLSTPGFLRTLNAKGMKYLLLAPPTGTRGEVLTTGAVAGFAIAEQPAGSRLAAAQRLARWLTSAEIAQAVPGWYLGPPARRSVGAFYERPGYAALLPLLAQARYLHLPCSAGFYEGTIIPHLQAAVLGQDAPEEALRAIQSAWRRQALD